MFLLIGYTTEKSFRHFVTHVAHQGIQADVLDLSQVRECSSMEIHEATGELTVRLGTKRYEFHRYGAFYSRMYWTDLGSTERNQALTRLTRALTAWLVSCPGTVANRPGAGMSNANKFCHLEILKSYGLLTAKTELLGSPEELLAIASKEKEWVSKSSSSTKTKAALLTDALLQRRDALRVCPTTFQERIVGCDVRVHVVGEQLLAERIDSERLDYRFSDSQTAPNEHRICDVPYDVAGSCIAYCRDEGLMFAGFDFKVTESGFWYVLEANQMPGYESYDRRQNGRISDALILLLTSGIETPRQRTRRRIAKCGAPDDRSFCVQDHQAASKLLGDDAADVMEPFITADRRPVLSPFHLAPLKPTETWTVNAADGAQNAAEEPWRRSTVTSIARVLTAEECSKMRARILRLRERWITRGDGRFYTLGVASYLDARENHTLYLERAHTTNEVLLGEFGDLYDKLCNALRASLNEEVWLSARCALPGFHIFLFDGSNRSKESAAAKAHFDLQWRHAYPGHADRGSLSFTMLIDEPSGGAAMEVWDFRYPDTQRHRESAAIYAQAHASRRIPYELGRVVVHDGYDLHAIGRSLDDCPEGYRMTLQGHAIRVDGGWEMYW